MRIAIRVQNLRTHYGMSLNDGRMLLLYVKAEQLGIAEFLKGSIVAGLVLGYVWLQTDKNHRFGFNTGISPVLYSYGLNSYTLQVADAP